MEAFSLLKFWRITAGDDSSGGSSDHNVTTISTNATFDDDEEESFFDLEFPVPGCDDKKHSHSREVDLNGSDSDEEDPYSDSMKKDASAFPESPTDVFFKGRVSNSNSKPQSPTSFLRYPPKFRVFMLFKKPKLQKSDVAGVSPATLEHHQAPIFSLLARVNSSRGRLQGQSSDEVPSKRFAKDVVQKYLKLIKPLYVRVSKNTSEKMRSSGEFLTQSSSPSLALARSPSKQGEEKQGSRGAPLRVVCKHLGKSRSASSAAGIMPLPASKRDDSLQLQHEGIQSAILHCKRSYNSSREFSLLSRSASDPCYEISVKPRISIEEKKRSSI
ncbi:hypothetical protein NMG60_11022213 [Bertholletia excelsa]